MSDTVFCTCGKEVQVRTDKRIAKHVSGERLKRGLLVTSALAKIYPASRKTIWRIKNGTTWRYA